MLHGTSGDNLVQPPCSGPAMVGCPKTYPNVFWIGLPLDFMPLITTPGLGCSASCQSTSLSAHAAHASTARMAVLCELSGVLQLQCSAQMTTQTLHGKTTISTVKVAFFSEVYSSRVMQIKELVTVHTLEKGNLVKYVHSLKGKQNMQVAANTNKKFSWRAVQRVQTIFLLQQFWTEQARAVFYSRDKYLGH